MIELDLKKKKWVTPKVYVIDVNAKNDGSRHEATLPVDGTFNGNETHSFPGIGKRYLHSFIS